LKKILIRGCSRLVKGRPGQVVPIHYQGLMHILIGYNYEEDEEE
jgi:hypothetical protein